MRERTGGLWKHLHKVLTQGIDAIAEPILCEKERSDSFETHPLTPYTELERRLEKRLERVFKGAISRILSGPQGERGDHLSERPNPNPARTSAGNGRAALRFPIWSCTRWGLPCLLDHSRER